MTGYIELTSSWNHTGSIALLSSPKDRKIMLHIGHWQEVYHHIRVIFYTFI